MERAWKIHGCIQRLQSSARDYSLFPSDHLVYYFLKLLPCFVLDENLPGKFENPGIGNNIRVIDDAGLVALGQ